MSVTGTIQVVPAVSMLIVAVDRDPTGTKVLCEFIVGDDPPKRRWIKVGESWRADMLLDLV